VRLFTLATMALTGGDDTIRFENGRFESEWPVGECSARSTDDDLRTLCAELAADGILQPADPSHPGDEFRFANAFLPQLLLMTRHAAVAPPPGPR
jgi:hypothetical protein